MINLLSGREGFPRKKMFGSSPKTRWSCNHVLHVNSEQTNRIKKSARSYEWAIFHRRRSHATDDFSVRFKFSPEHRARGRHRIWNGAKLCRPVEFLPVRWKWHWTPNGRDQFKLTEFLLLSDQLTMAKLRKGVTIFRSQSIFDICRISQRLNRGREFQIVAKTSQCR